MQNGDNFSLLEGIADKLNAAIGAPTAVLPFLITPSNAITPDFIVGDINKQMGEPDSILMQV